MVREWGKYRVEGGEGMGEIKSGRRYGNGGNSECKVLRE